MTAMDEATELANAVDSKDPRVGLRAVAALRRRHDQPAPRLGPPPPAAGWSWQEIASELGVSRQAVHKKHAARRGLLRRD
jgi:AraC-like DNA-binding protein